MATSTSRRRVIAWISACFLAAPAFAQTRGIAPVEGVSAPVAPVVSASAGLGAVVSPISFSASNLFAAPSAPASNWRYAASPQALPALAAASAAAPHAAVTAGPSAAAAPISAALLSHEAAAVAVSHPQAENSREAAAIATVEGGVADWTARSAQTLEAPSVLAAASEGTSPLDRSSMRSAAAPSAPPAPSKFKTLVGWLGPILAMAGLVLSIDAGTKFYAAHHLFTLFHEVAWRKPLILALVPFILYTAYAARAPLSSDHLVTNWSVWKIFNGRLGFDASWSWKKIFNGRLGFYGGESLSGMDTMIKDHPSLRWAVRIYDVSIALMVGGMLGNGIDTLLKNGALDWIPLGRSLMNFADVAVILGLSYFQASSTFFLKAAAAHKAGKPMYFSYAWFLGLPLAGVFAAWAFGSAAGGDALDLAMKNVGFLYLMAFSMLIGFGRFVGIALVNVFVKKFVAEEGSRLAATPGATRPG